MFVPSLGMLCLMMIFLDMQSDYDENKVATYDDYCDDTYAIKVTDNYCHNFEYPFTEHYSFNVETIFSSIMNEFNHITST